MTDSICKAEPKSGDTDSGSRQERLVMPDIEFRTCPYCAGYGVRDNGNNCTTCGGKGSGGLRTKNGCIGSGDLMYDKATGRRITAADLARMTKA